MTEQEPEFRPEEHEPAPRAAPVDAADAPSENLGAADSEATGVPGVDAALAEVDGVEELPLEEQLAAFERAHHRLRAALDSEPVDPA